MQAFQLVSFKKPQKNIICETLSVPDKSKMKTYEIGL